MCDKENDVSDKEIDNENNNNNRTITKPTRILKRRKRKSSSPTRLFLPLPQPHLAPQPTREPPGGYKTHHNPTSFPFSIPVNYSSRETRLKHPGNTT